MRIHTRAALIASTLTLFISSSALAVGIKDFSRLVVFGDSIVDAGNTQNALGGPTATPCAFTGGAPPCDPAPASFGYFEGRFTNGPNGADVLNDAISGGNSVATTEGGTNYSFGGARAVGGSLPDITLQAGSYLLDNGGIADPDALYLINIGGNDVRDQIQSTEAGTATQTNQMVIDAVVAAVTSQISVLQGAGAEYFLVAGIGNVGTIPETLALSPAAQADGTALSEDLTAQLFEALDPGIFTLDVIALFNLVNADPTAFGLPKDINVTGSCLIDGSPPACGDFAFFDTVHPSDALHQILGEGLIAAVPEPGTGLLLGMGLLGLARSRRSQLAA